MKKVIAFALLIAALIIPLSTFPTCIVIIKNGDHIYVAADMRATYDTKSPDLAHKIFISHSGKFYYTSAGVAGGGTDYIIDTTLGDIPNTKNINRLRKILCSYLDTALLNRNNIAQTSYDTMIKYSSIKQVAIFYAESNRLYIDTILFKFIYVNSTYKIVSSLGLDIDSAYLGLKELKGTPKDSDLRLRYDTYGYVINFVLAERNNGNQSVIDCPIEPFILDIDGRLHIMPKMLCH
jgi:hypothetical protein